LLSPDSALLGGSERIIVPFAGPVSFFGFMLLGPALLIALRVYLQIYIEHSDRLDQLARSGTMALKLDRLSRNLAIIATLMDPRFRHSLDACCQ
jgi:hypothetical protein